VSPVGFAYADEVSVLEQAGRSAAVSHDHPEGIKGAQAVALAVFLRRRGATKDSLRVTLERLFGYDLRRTVDEIRPTYRFDVSCQGSVPEAIVAFLDSADWESAVRNAVSLGGDSDTQACIAGAIAEAFYGRVPSSVREQVRARLPADLREVADRFEVKCRFRP
jgi:ADP-ribosylglycohydrolase